MGKKIYGIYKCDGNLFNHEEKWNHGICREIDGTGNHYVQRNKPDSEWQTQHVCSHMGSLDLNLCICIHMYVCKYKSWNLEGAMGGEILKERSNKASIIEGKWHESRRDMAGGQGKHEGGGDKKAREECWDHEAQGMHESAMMKSITVYANFKSQ